MKVSLCCGVLFVGGPNNEPEEIEIGICPLCHEFCEIVQSSVLEDSDEEKAERNYAIEE